MTIRPDAPGKDGAIDQLVDEFIARSRLLNGRELVERMPWNTAVTADAVRHFAFGTSDDNPLWLDEDYARNSPQAGLSAPPAFLCSVLYPFLHGEPMAVPMSSLIGKIAMEWFRAIRIGDALRAVASQTEVTESRDRRGRRIVLIDAETNYRNQRGELVGTAHGTMVRIARTGDDLLLQREISRYDDDQRSVIGEALESESRRGDRTRSGEEVWLGQLLPTFVRGPLSVGDLVCWQAAIGPSYRGGALGYRDILRSPHQAAINPITGWPVKYSQQHEDFLLASQRGMPAPFDNSLMRFAWLAPMLTDWMGDGGFLRRLSVQTDAPILYGDTTWYQGVVTGKQDNPENGATAVTIAIFGVNQLGQQTTTGEAEVVLPPRRARPTRPSRRAPGLGGHPGGPLELFDRQVAARPQAIALQCGDHRLTFAELDARATGLARNLEAAGARAGTSVALWLERDLAAPIAILATLKAGCSYLPIDAGLSAERLSTILASVSPSLILVPEARLPQVAAAIGEPVGLAGSRLRAPECLVDGAAASPLLPGSVIEQDDLAYIMPTSGTLAMSKLVAVSHGSLARYLLAIDQPLGVTHDDICLHTAAFTFSASVRQLFLALCSGAQLVIAQDAHRFDATALWQLMRSRAVTVWDTVPSLWRTCMDSLAELGDAERAVLLDCNLRLVLSTGEALPWPLVRRWRRDFNPVARIVNLYSQTETAGTVCTCEVPEALPDGNGNVPLGRPVAFTTIDLVDATLRPVPPGEIGEICVGGSRLGAGYVGATNAAPAGFVLRPFHHHGSYRTGDLARRRDDGILEFVGRADQRIKVRGQRVDLLEVEAALRSLPGIVDAAVVTHALPPDDVRLVAYVATAEGSAIDPAIILAQVRPLLSSAALPALIVHLASLPRNAAGKIDRSALPPPPSATFADAAAPPDDSALARRVERIFADALHLPGVDHNASFFDLGGNSLLASVLISRLRTAFATPLPMISFFERPTVAAVAAVIEESLLREIEALPEAEAERLLGREETL